MFKKQNKHSLIYKNIYKSIFVMLLILGFFVNLLFAFTLKVPLGDALDGFYDKAQKNKEINDMQGKAIVEDLYTKSLNTVKSNQMLPVFESLNKTADYFNTEYVCSIDSQDIINILYFSNDGLKRDLKNNLMGFEEPQKEDMGKSCNKLNVCIYDPVGGSLNNTISLNNFCQKEIEDIFIDFYLNAYYVYNLDGGNKGSNLFWNGSLEDSSYDIMNDVNILSKILFEGASDPQETRFYKMPNVNYNSSFVDPPISMDIDWFSPYNNYSTGNVTGTTGTQNTGGSGLSITGYSSFEEIIDGDIQDFVESINISMGGNADTLIGGNQCITGFQFTGAEGSTTGSLFSQETTPSEYLSGVLEEVEQMSCNLDGICQNWETTDCEDCISEGGGNTDFEEIEQLLNSAEQLSGDIDGLESELGCFQTCDTLPCTATSCDKFVCYAKCSCQVYESPIFDPIQKPGLSSVFKIKFCIVPVIENELEEGKTVYTLSSVFTEIYNVLKKLRNSGETMVRVKTKEFMDTSYKDNNFSEQLSFSINSNTKPVFSKESEKQQTDAQVNFNTTLMEGILGFAKDPRLEQDKNKYIVVDEPCEYIVKQNIVSNPDEATELMNNCLQEKEEMLVELPPMEDLLKDQKTVLLDAEFENFLRQNANFWYEVKQVFGEFKESARVLSEK